ncbi:DUF3224 domain-containing protein [Nocardiopsis alba]|uniref:DUF3224 domain-containing protein n=1 Tax=Nocardiopsis alba TaxID=53437 RepID=UPI00366BFCA3
MINGTRRLRFPPVVAFAATTMMILVACAPVSAATPVSHDLPVPAQEREAHAQVDLLDQTVTEIGPADDPSGTLLLNTVFQTEFTGDLEGSGYHVYLDTIDAAGYATSEGAGRFVGSLDGISGTFLMQATGTAGPDGAIDASWCVVEGSASGGLEGLSGCGEITTTGTPVANATLVYTLP